MDYHELIGDCSTRLEPDEWVPVLCGKQGERYVAFEAKSKDASAVQLEIIRLANLAKSCANLYVVHRHEDGRTSVHLPGWRDATGEWYAGQGYETALYESERAWDWDLLGETFTAPQPRLRPSGLAERIGRGAMERRAAPCNASIV